MWFHREMISRLGSVDWSMVSVNIPASLIGQWIPDLKLYSPTKAWIQLSHGKSILARQWAAVKTNLELIIAPPHSLILFSPLSVYRIWTIHGHCFRPELILPYDRPAEKRFDVDGTPQVSSNVSPSFLQHPAIPELIMLILWFYPILYKLLATSLKQGASLRG